MHWVLRLKGYNLFLLSFESLEDKAKGVGGTGGNIFGAVHMFVHVCVCVLALQVVDLTYGPKIGIHIKRLHV